MTTLRDIAAHFGLSDSTVSRILNGKGRASADTRSRVLKYAKEFDYHPNQLAKSLKNRQSNTIGVLIPDITNEYYAVLFKAIEDRMRKHGLMAILFNSDEAPEREETFLEYLHSAQVDGMIIATSGAPVYSTLASELIDRIVFVDNRPFSGSREVDYIGSDNIASSFLLTEHLISRGYDRIATLVGSLSESSAQERLEGFRKALADHAIPERDEWIVRTNFLYEDGVAKAVELLSANERPNAVIAQNNVLAYAAIRVAKGMGLGVPGDLAVCCFDHIDIYGFMRPVITSVVQPVSLIAAAAADAWLERRADPSRPALSRLFSAEFRFGETS